MRIQRLGCFFHYCGTGQAKHSTPGAPTSVPGKLNKAAQQHICDVKLADVLRAQLCNGACTVLQGLYARRDNMTDVLIEALSGGPRVRIKCNSYVRKIAVHDNLVAVQVAQSFVVYEQSSGDGESVQYAIKCNIAIHRECDLLQVLITTLAARRFCLVSDKLSS
jgi:hypothetical protein